MSRSIAFRLGAVVALASTVAASGCARSTDAADYPTRPIEVVAPYPAGSGTDTVSRLIVEAINQRGDLEQKLQVVNKDGGGGTVGTSAVINADPDGYTVGVMPDGPLTMMPHVQELSYDPAGIELLTTIVESPVMVVVPADSPYESLDQLFEAAAEKPNTITIGEGPLNYKVPLQMIETGTDADFKSIVIDSDGSAITSLLGGNLDASMLQLTGALPQLKAGKIRALGVMADESSPLAPEVPTFTSLGHDMVWSAFYAFGVPSGLPDDVEEKLGTALRDAVASDEFADAAAELGMTAIASSAEDAQAAVDAKFDSSAEFLK